MKRSIVIADADAYLAGIFARRFEEGGWHVRVAESLEETRRLLKKARPDVLLIDPETIEDALDLIAEMRESDHERVARVVLTKLGDRKAIAAANEAGAHTYLLKGHFVPVEVRAKLEKLVEGGVA